MIAGAVIAVGAYVLGKVKKKGLPPSNQVLIVNIFPEVKQLVDRIGNIGGVERIEIAQPRSKARDSLVIDERTQEIVRSLEYQLVPGTRRVIAGVVTRLLPSHFDSTLGMLQIITFAFRWLKSSLKNCAVYLY